MLAKRTNSEVEQLLNYAIFIGGGGGGEGEDTFGNCTLIRKLCDAFARLSKLWLSKMGSQSYFTNTNLVPNKESNVMISVFMNRGP